MAVHMKLSLWFCLVALLIAGHAELVETEGEEVDEHGTPGADAEEMAEDAAAEDDGEMDHDHDGQTKEASVDQLRKLHTKIDANGDGKVSIQEIRDFHAHFTKDSAHKEMKHTIQWSDVDKNNDGKASIEEHLKFTHEDPESTEGDGPAYPGSVLGDPSDPNDAENKKAMDRSKELERAKFKAIDTDGDGLLTHDEWLQLQHPESSPALVDIVVAATLREKDADGDHKLSQKEFLANSRGDDEDPGAAEAQAEGDDSFFKEFDTDHSGFIDQKELENFEFGFKNTQDELDELLKTVDNDKDSHLSQDELSNAISLVGESGQYMLNGWVDHHEL